MFKKYKIKKRKKSVNPYYIFVIFAMFVTLFLICVAKIKRKILTNKKITRIVSILICFNNNSSYTNNEQATKI